MRTTISDFAHKKLDLNTERLKATDQMTWVQRMNSIRNRAEEIVVNSLVYS